MIESCYVQNFHESGDSNQTKQPVEATICIIFQQIFKWNQSKTIYQKRPLEDVGFGHQSELTHRLLRFRVFVLSEEAEDEV